MLARHSGFSSALLLRGTEGGVTPSLRKSGKFFRYWSNSPDIQIEANPLDLGIKYNNRLVPVPKVLLPKKDAKFGPNNNNIEIAKLSAQEGLAALDGAQSPTSDALLFSASLTLWHLNRCKSLAEAAIVVKEILTSGRAAKRFRKAL